MSEYLRLSIGFEIHSRHAMKMDIPRIEIINKEGFIWCGIPANGVGVFRRPYKEDEVDKLLKLGWILDEDENTWKFPINAIVQTTGGMMLSDKTIRRLQKLLDCNSDERRVVLYTAGLPKKFLNLIDVDGDINKLIMRIAYRIDDWEDGLQEKFESELQNSPLFKPVEPESKSDNWPILKIWVWEGESLIVGVWGVCSPELLVDIEKDLQESFCDEKDNTEIMIQITGYTKPEYEGPDMTCSGYHEYDVISKETLDVPF